MLALADPNRGDYGSAEIVAGRSRRWAVPRRAFRELLKKQGYVFDDDPAVDTFTEAEENENEWRYWGAVFAAMDLAERHWRTPKGRRKRTGGLSGPTRIAASGRRVARAT